MQKNWNRNQLAAKLKELYNLDSDVGCNPLNQQSELSHLISSNINTHRLINFVVLHCDMNIAEQLHLMARLIGISVAGLPSGSESYVESISLLASLSQHRENKIDDKTLKGITDYYAKRANNKQLSDYEVALFDALTELTIVSRTKNSKTLATTLKKFLDALVMYNKNQLRRVRDAMKDSA